MARESLLHRTFLRNVRARREELGLTQEDVAIRLQISQPAYAQIETGRRIPGLDTVERVAAALESTPMDLLGVLKNRLAAVDSK